jgi:ABC-type antimicrobial peptide transport system permease subunit
MPIRDHLAGGLRPALGALLIAVAGVLLIACVNVTSLLLARSIERAREYAVRRALGANTRQLLLQLFSEALVLAVAAAAAAFALALWVVDLIVGLMPAAAIHAAAITTDWRVVLFAAAVAMLRSSEASNGSSMFAASGPPM